MKRKIISFLLTVLVGVNMVSPVQAASLRLDDGAGLLNTSEEASVIAKLDEISERHDMDIVVVTTYGTDGKSMMDYADDYYDYHDYGEDGVLLAIDMDTRQWWISTSGYGITAVSDTDREQMENYFVPPLSEGDYERAFINFADCCDRLITAANTGQIWEEKPGTEEEFFPAQQRSPFPVPWPLLALFCLFIGLLVALIYTGQMKRKLKNVRMQKAAANYVREGSFLLNIRQDLYLYSNVTRVERPKDDDDNFHSGSSGHGLSSTHTSSSGTTHGGGGGSF